MRVPAVTPGKLNGAKILVLDSSRNSYVTAPDIEAEVFGPGIEVTLVHADSVAALPASALACDGVICWHLVDLPAHALARFNRCRAIVRAAVGVDNIDLIAARLHRIAIANVPDYGTEEVADHTLALALALLRRLPRADAAVRGGSWDWRDLGPLPRLSDLTIGLIGLGRIGAAVARRFLAFGCRVVFYDPYRDSGWEKSLGTGRCETLDALLDEADLVSLHLPLTLRTTHLLGQAELRRLAGKYLVNTARGGLIEPHALAAAVAAGQLAGVALDVYADETAPPPPAMLAPEVLWSPHVAFYSDKALPELRRKAASCLKTLLISGQHRNLL
ncbi:NAD(P)-dependent oxidoreductase [Pseudomonas sp. RIT-PI-S]|uniref:NAD(P)-dependent oxidoreductase n=1 Tax=Pseudomonas sp. RIT-PI-S TaxID=3035295 RepID=UPI0021DAA8BC|nr:NAD(P)-dependent oxidoreductase [Pseudomonas sp. RIT-PI-S]